MRIAIDALGISQPGGGRTATLNLLTALFEMDRENDYWLFVDEEEQALMASNVQQRVVGVKGRFVSRLWAQSALPVVLRGNDVALVHYIKNLGAFFTPGKTVVTVYDLSVLVSPRIYPLSDQLYWRLIEPLTLRQADRVIAISEDTASDIVSFYGIPRERIAVIYPGCNPRFRPLSAAAKDSVRHKYGLPETFILHVGSISRKKNLLPLVRAVHRLKQAGRAVKLVLVGRVYGKAHDDELFHHIHKGEMSDQVVLLGAVPDEDLPAVYNCATVMAFPSVQEGFGLVPLEAMACGLPVVTSGAGAIREVVGDAALVVSKPDDEAEWASATERVLRDTGLWSRMRSLGLARARLFSNEESARQVLEVYREVTGKSMGSN
jgi:glycosyltransferase involved in cell wall biosynthesis